MGAGDQTDDIHDELVELLGESCQVVPGEAWRVEQVLKRSDVEVTELVSLRTADGGEVGPYVRKRIVSGRGVGEAWRLLAEAQRAGARTAQLPRVVSCRDADGVLHVVMERVPGRSLREVVGGMGADERLAFAQAMMPALCEATRELHEDLGRPLVHRDITPSNIICSGLDGSVPVLVDLGIARAWKQGVETDTAHFGTKGYAAPEQFGFGQTDARSDVYALGLVAFFCLTGRDPAPADRERAFADPVVPEPWRQVIARAAALDPAERPASARELRAAFETLGHTGAASTAWDVREHVGAGRGLTARGLVPRIWRARNWVILPLAAFLVLVSVTSAFDTAALNRDGRYLTNLFGYLVYMPCLFLAAAFVAADKSWLRTHVRFVRERGVGRLVRVMLAIVIALTLVLFVLSGPVV